MSRKVYFTDHGWEDYQYWQTQDKRTLKKINNLIEDTRRNGCGGIGKPEPLKGNLFGRWSKEIDDKNRLIFIVDDVSVEIYSCRGHYDDH